MDVYSDLPSDNVVVVADHERVIPCRGDASSGSSVSELWKELSSKFSGELSSAKSYLYYLTGLG